MILNEHMRCRSIVSKCRRKKKKTRFSISGSRARSEPISDNVFFFQVFFLYLFRFVIYWQQFITLRMCNKHDERCADPPACRCMCAMWFKSFMLILIKCVGFWCKIVFCFFVEFGVEWFFTTWNLLLDEARASHHRTNASNYSNCIGRMSDEEMYAQMVL